jgi:internalin A
MKHILKQIIFSILGLPILGVFAQTYTIPDPVFLNHLKTTYSGLIDSQNKLVGSQAATFTDTLRINGLGLSSIEGVQYFVNLRGINASNNNLTTLPKIGRMSNLQTLNLINNNISSLSSFDSLLNLTNIYASGNSLTKLPSLTKNLKMQNLHLSDNELTLLPTLDANVNLRIIDVSNNKLASLPDLSKLVLLQRLYCSANRLINLPSLTNLVNLKRIRFSKNLLTVPPNFSANINLTEIYADSNRLTEAPDISRITTLDVLQIQNNYLTFDDLGILRSQLSIVDYTPQFYTPRFDTVSTNEKQSVFLVSTFDDTTNTLQYKWYLNGVLQTTTSSPTYNIVSPTVSMAGVYEVRVVSSTYPLLVLNSDYVNFRVAKVANCPQLVYAQIDTLFPTCTSLGKLKISWKGNYADSVSIRLVNKDNLKESIPNSQNEFTDLRSGDYVILITSQDSNCTDNMTQDIVLNSKKCDEIVLTPNNDGFEDTLYFSQSGNAQIINDKGKVVKDLKLPIDWDGSAADGYLPQGYYLVNINNGKEYLHVSVIY